MNKTEITQKVKDLLIIRENDGSYNLFGKYSIKSTNDLYVVSIIDETETYLFSNLCYAVTWCVFDKNKKNKDVKRIADLDNQLASLNVSISQFKKLIEHSTSVENKHIYMAKLYEEKIKKQRALKELNEYALTSKYWQRKKYEENKG